MKNLRQLCMALVLTLSLSVVALAGQVDCPGVTQPPPEEVTSEMQSGVDITITEALLTLIEVVLVP
jgi:hypothetical protein